ncbi:hypothetical protein BDK51DRAFT_51854 [Blyttiomyces helicus]|uniref:Uncharacterized protein n=1 Tax=Blyttiomyces helicus TaxID=388810 RepID=A0A4P9W897_9FUNG|nr:hypothetical protein BDK51DRAFT_51854 [Blyttiomyces helicus]|eukprot:RKO87673.1 hypothetical protein BDK51DRAFT_51854 [Blyttiomyces helicus]
MQISFRFMYSPPHFSFLFLLRLSAIRCSGIGRAWAQIPGADLDQPRVKFARFDRFIAAVIEQSIPGIISYFIHMYRVGLFFVPVAPTQVYLTSPTPKTSGIPPNCSTRNKQDLEKLPLQAAAIVRGKPLLRVLFLSSLAATTLLVLLTGGNRSYPPSHPETARGFEPVADARIGFFAAGPGPAGVRVGGGGETSLTARETRVDQKIGWWCRRGGGETNMARREESDRDGPFRDQLSGLRG